MTLCPIAIVAGCKKCPAFTVCPLKSVIGDYSKEEEMQKKQQADTAKRDEKLMSALRLSWRGSPSCGVKLEHRRTKLFGRCITRSTNNTNGNSPQFATALLP